MKALCWLVLLVLPCSLLGQAKSGQRVFKTPREFVQAFYNWYTPRALKENATTASDLALKFKRSLLGHNLARLLQEDSDAQAKCGELIGIDFDPFLFSQEPAARYEVGDISQKGQSYLVDVFAVRLGHRGEKPDVVAELEEKDGQWIFMNFHDPSDGTDLLTILRSPRPPCTVPRPAKKKHTAAGGSL